MDERISIPVPADLAARRTVGALYGLLVWAIRWLILLMVLTYDPLAPGDNRASALSARQGDTARYCRTRATVSERPSFIFKGWGAVLTLERSP